LNFIKTRQNFRTPRNAAVPRIPSFTLPIGKIRLSAPLTLPPIATVRAKTVCIVEEHLSLVACEPAGIAQQWQTIVCSFHFSSQLNNCEQTSSLSC
jgi:hypothetical protein